MKIGVYIHASSDTVFSGVDNKIRDQIDVLSKEYRIFEITVKKAHTSLFNSLTWRLPGGSYGREYDKSYSEIESFDKVAFFFIRNQPWDRDFMRFIRRICTNYPHSKILLEIPTYPYSRELIGSATMWPWYFKDRLYQRYYKEYVDRIVTYSDDETIYNVKTIKTINGISVDNYAFCEAQPESVKDGTIHLLAVAQFQKSHGYERVIRGLFRYYQNGGKRSIIIDLVGEGEELRHYRKLVNRLSLNRCVYFHGFKYGKELDHLYAGADATLGCFGLYKRNVERLSPIKTREYIARGLPVISGFCEDVFTGHDDADFFLEFPNNDSDVNIDRILMFIDELYSKHSLSEIRERIHAFAKENADIFQTMKPIMDYLSA